MLFWFFSYVNPAFWVVFPFKKKHYVELLKIRQPCLFLIAVKKIELFIFSFYLSPQHLTKSQKKLPIALERYAQITIGN